MKTGAECFESAFAHTLDLAVQCGAGFILEAQPGAPIPFDSRVTPRRKSRCDKANRNEMNAILSKNVLEQVIAVSMPPVGVGKRPPPNDGFWFSRRFRYLGPIRSRRNL
jgi:hypothetical protein